MHSKGPAQQNKSLINSLDCLFSLVSSGEPVGSREMARRLKMEHTKVNRLLGTLAQLGLAEQTADRKYIPGPGIEVLAAMSLRGSRLLKASLPVIEQLIQENGTTVALGVLWQRYVCYLYHGGLDRQLQASIAGHDLYDAEKSSIGKVLLSQLPTEEINELYADSELPEDRLLALFGELADIRRNGYARVPGSVAVPVGNPARAAIAITGTAGQQASQDTIEKLKEAAARIATQLCVR